MCLDDVSLRASGNIQVFILMGSIMVAYFHRTRLSAECLIRLMYIIRFQCIKLVRNGIAKVWTLMLWAGTLSSCRQAAFQLQR